MLIKTFLVCFPFTSDLSLPLCNSVWATHRVGLRVDLGDIRWVKRPPRTVWHVCLANTHPTGSWSALRVWRTLGLWQAVAGSQIARAMLTFGHKITTVCPNIQEIFRFWSLLWYGWWGWKESSSVFCFPKSQVRLKHSYFFYKKNEFWLFYLSLVEVVLHTYLHVNGTSSVWSKKMSYVQTVW